MADARVSITNDFGDPAIAVDFYHKEKFDEFVLAAKPGADIVKYFPEYILEQSMRTLFKDYAQQWPIDAGTAPASVAFTVRPVWLTKIKEVAADVVSWLLAVDSTLEVEVNFEK